MTEFLSSAVVLRCCDEEDVKDLLTFIMTTSPESASELTEDMIEIEVCNSSCQWYSVETNDEVVFAVFKLVVDHDPLRIMAIITDIFVLTKVKQEESLFRWIISFIFKKSIEICLELAISMICIEVYEDNDLMIQILDENGYVESGGYYVEHRSLMKFKYCKNILIEKCTNLGTDTISIVQDLELSVVVDDKTLVHNDEDVMFQLVEELFAALHKEYI